MAFAALDGGTQVTGRSLNPLFLQEVHPFSDVQTAHRIVVQIGRGILARSTRPETACQEKAASAWLAIDGIQPFSHTWAIHKGVPRLQVEEMFELVQDNQPALFSVIEEREKSQSLI